MSELGDTYVGYALVGQRDGRGSKHVIWINNTSRTRAAAWPPDDICRDDTWETVEPLRRESDLAQHDAEVARAAKVEALREAADEWTQSAWAKDMAPGNDRPSLILGTSQRSANFLRAVADRIEAGEGA